VGETRELYNSRRPLILQLIETISILSSLRGVLWEPEDVLVRCLGIDSGMTRTASFKYMTFYNNYFIHLILLRGVR
jgi:hypothetical protein